MCEAGGFMCNLATFLLALSMKLEKMSLNLGELFPVFIMEMDYCFFKRSPHLFLGQNSKRAIDKESVKC